MTIDAGGTAVIERDAEDATARSTEETVKFGVSYSCIRCGTITTGAEIEKLPEIKCICGFKVFIKVRPPIVKTIKAI